LPARGAQRRMLTSHGREVPQTSCHKGTPLRRTGDSPPVSARIESLIDIISKLRGIRAITRTTRTPDAATGVSPPAATLPGCRRTTTAHRSDRSRPAFHYRRTRLDPQTTHAHDRA